jgi:transposase
LKKLKRYRVGELPLIYEIAQRINLKDLLYEFIPLQGNEDMPTVETLMLLIYNLTTGKFPLYELDAWVKDLNLGAIGLGSYKETVNFTDDRFGRALDKLFEVDRASLMTKIVLAAVKVFNIELEQIHNDSTSIKAFGEYPHKSSTGLEFKKGVSKDHRPDLKQLVYSLTISHDGAVPIHYKAYPGNRNDDSTHIETWAMLSKTFQKKDFLYVADCKLCTDRQLSHIADHGGRVVTVIPENWKEVSTFKESLRKEKKNKTEIWRRERDDEEETVYYYAFDEKCYTNIRGYTIHWILSTDNRTEDFEKRERLLGKAEIELRKLLSQINKRNLKTEEAIRKKCEEILKKRQAGRFLNVDINKISVECVKTRKRKDKVVDVKTVKTEYTLSWNRNKTALKQEKNVDGVFPILTTDPDISPKEALLAYKYQPNLEKRFSQFKSIHNAAPIFFKKIERVEANMFLFFISLMLQALVEREVRSKMTEYKLEYLNVYPESREAVHPTTSKICDRFSQISTYEIVENNVVIERYQDELSEVHLRILEMLGISSSKYWQGIIMAVA